jgi:glycine oxidase
MSSASSTFDALIVGGGVIGCAIAWRLAQAGLHVAVIERSEPGQEASWAAGGMLAPLAEADQSDAFLELALASRASYANFARELRAATGIDIEYRTEGTLYLALTDEDEQALQPRWQWQHAAGLNVKKLKADCVRKLEPSLTNQLRWALKFPDDHQVDNRRLSRALELAARKAGAVFHTQTQVEAIDINHSRINGVFTSRGYIATSTAIIAAGSWSTSISLNTLSHLCRIQPVRGQMVALKMPEPALQHVIYAHHSYLIPRLSGVVIAGSTTEEVGFDKRITAGGINTILRNAIEIAPALAEQTIVETWAGLRPRAGDEWPVLGADGEIQNLIYATGHYRNGILLTPITAQAISELVSRGTTSIDLKPFSPQRFD